MRRRLRLRIERELDRDARRPRRPRRHRDGHGDGDRDPHPDPDAASRCRLVRWRASGDEDGVHRGGNGPPSRSSDEAQEVDVDGYDLMKDTVPGKPTTFSFKASITGIFEVEFEESGQQIGERGSIRAAAPRQSVHPNPRPSSHIGNRGAHPRLIDICSHLRVRCHNDGTKSDLRLCWSRQPRSRSSGPDRSRPARVWPVGSPIARRLKANVAMSKSPQPTPIPPLRPWPTAAPVPVAGRRLVVLAAPFVALAVLPCSATRRRRGLDRQPRLGAVVELYARTRGNVRQAVGRNLAASSRARGSLGHHPGRRPGRR